MTKDSGSGATPIVIHGLGAVALLGLAMAGYLLVVDPVVRGRSAQESLEQHVRIDTERFESLRATRDSLRGKVEAGQQRLDKSGVSLLALSGRNTRMGELTELAVECGLRLDRLQPGEPTPGEMFTITPIMMQGAGSYSDAAMFLHLIVERFADVSARSFRLEAQGDPDRKASFVFELAWYADPADLPDPAGG